MQTPFYKQMYIDDFDGPWNEGDLASAQFTFFIFLGKPSCKKSAVFFNI